MKITVSQLKKIIKEEILKESFGTGPSMEEMVKAVKKHARENYNNGGWDYVVEAFDDKEIAEEIGNAKSIEEAIKNIGKLVALLHDREEDIRSEIF